VTAIVVSTGDGAVTVTADEPVFPLAAAVMVALPPATPVTTPACETVAATAFELAHVKLIPDMLLPC
jgi:hypothetical protein